MIGYFPEPYPDELFYSLCARFSDRMQYPSRWAVTRDLFGMEGTAAVIDLPSHLGFLANTLPPRHPCKSVDRLIDDHTFLPFYGPFQPVERLEFIRQDMIESQGPSPCMHAGLNPCPIQRPAWLKFCPSCVEEDRKSFEECYWHRVHQVPGVEVCPVHNVILEDSEVRAYNSITPYEFVAAERAVQKTAIHSSSFPASFHRHLLDIARDAAWLLNQRGLAAGPELLRCRYKLSLVDHDLATYSGIIKTNALIETFKAHYPPGFLTLVQCEVTEKFRQNWMIRITRGTSQFQHPLRHLLLIHFLGHTAETFFELPTEFQPFGTGPWPCLNYASHHYGQPTIQECQITYTQQCHPLGTFACSCGFVYTRTGPDQSTKDQFQAHRYKSFGPVWDEKLETLWKEPNLNLAQIAKQLGVDPHTAKRRAARLGLPFPPLGGVINKNTKTMTSAENVFDPSLDSATVHERRMEWLSIIQEYPEASRTWLHNKCPNLKRWLQRHDREWLEAHLPPCKVPNHGRPKLPRSRVNWAERDVNLAGEVRTVVEHLRSVPGRPTRITFEAIGREIAQLKAVRSELDRLPLTSKVLSELVETHEEYIVRRVWWVAGLYQQENIHPQRWQLLQRTSVKVQDFPKWPLVQEAIEEALQMLQQQEVTEPELWNRCAALNLDG